MILSWQKSRISVSFFFDPSKVAISSPVSTENENLIFRGNTFATKAVDTYMKMVGENVSFVFFSVDGMLCQYIFSVYYTMSG